MSDAFARSCAHRYAALTDPLSGPLGSAARSSSALFLCGMSACVDALVDLKDARPLLDAPAETPAGRLAGLLLSRAARGIGGEVRFEWEEGPAWLRERLRVRYALGGTGPQAAWVLGQLGVRSLVALEDRYAEMLRLIPEGVVLAQGGQVQPAETVAAAGPHVPEIFIFEFTAGVAIGPVVPPRSSRVVVRFLDRGIQHDQAFEDLSRQLAPSAAAGLLAGLNDEADNAVDAASRHVFALARDWKTAGLKPIHFELAGYASQRAVEVLLGHARGAITSLGMSHSELLAMNSSAHHPMEALIALGERLGLDRVCVHADTWAAAVTLNDPGAEEEALMAGCAIASARAARGAPARTLAVAPEAQFHPLPFEAPAQRGRWSFVACASPYVDKPATTLGLGDSFTAGCLLVLARHKHRAAPILKRA